MQLPGADRGSAAPRRILAVRGAVAQPPGGILEIREAVVRYCSILNSNARAKKDRHPDDGALQLHTFILVTIIYLYLACDRPRY